MCAGRGIWIQHKFSAVKGRCCSRRTDIERVSVVDVGRALVVVVRVVVWIRVRVLGVRKEGRVLGGTAGLGEEGGCGTAGYAGARLLGLELGHVERVRGREGGGIGGAAVAMERVWRGGQEEEVLDHALVLLELVRVIGGQWRDRVLSLLVLVLLVLC